MFMKLVRFEFETDAKIPPLFGWNVEDSRYVVRLFGEVQFVAAGVINYGNENTRGAFPYFDHLENFPLAVKDQFHRRPIARHYAAFDPPVTLETLAEKMFAAARSFVKERPLVGVHAVKLARFEDFANGVVYVPSLTPLYIVDGMLSHSPRGAKLPAAPRPTEPKGGES